MPDPSRLPLPFPIVDSPEAIQYNFDALADAFPVIAQWKPQSGLAQATGTITTLTSVAQDVPGCSLSFTPAVNSVAMIWGTFDFELAGSSDSTFDYIAHGRLQVNGVTQSQYAELRLLRSITGTPTLGTEATVSQFWRISLPARALTTVKLVVVGTIANGTGTGSTMSCLGGGNAGTELAYFVHAA